MMDNKEAIEYLRPIADNATISRYAEALETAIRAMEELPGIIEALKEDLRGDCDSCAKADDFQNCMVSRHYFNACEDCGEDCRCKNCHDGSEWEWRGIQEGSHGQQNH